MIRILPFILSCILVMLISNQNAKANSNGAEVCDGDAIHKATNGGINGWHCTVSEACTFVGAVANGSSQCDINGSYYVSVQHSYCALPDREYTQWFDASGNSHCEQNNCPEGEDYKIVEGGYGVACDPCPECDTFECGDIDHPEEKLTIKDGIVLHPFCAPDLQIDHDPCEDVLGYFNGNQVCGDDKNKCEADGGTYGHFNDIAVCIPTNDINGSDIEDVPPDCEDDEIAYHLGSGDMSCSHYDPPGENTEDKDTDGDGTPDKDDDDIDGDGVPNGSDPDKDGDGIPNADDPDEEGDDNEADGGGTCTNRPSCSGDQVLCAVLFQQWKTRCALEEEGEGDKSSSGGGSCDEPVECEGDVMLCGIRQQIHDSNCQLAEHDSSEYDDLFTDEPSDLFTDDEDGLENAMSGVFNQSGSGSSCPAPLPINLGSTSTSISFQPLCDTAGLLNPLVLFIFSLTGLRITMRGFES